MKFTRNQQIEIINMLYQSDVVKDNPLFLEETDNDLISYFDQIIYKLTDIDEVISDNLENYSLNRLSYLDRAIIRFFVFELLYSDNIVAKIINDAVEITKIYSDLDDEKQHKFTNRLLHNISLKVRS